MENDIAVSQEAPRFEVEDINGNPIHLADYQGTWVLVSFYRYATCPLCNLRMGLMIKEFEKYKDKVKMLAIFESPSEYIKEYITRKAPPFPLIGDAKGELYKLYGVKKSWLGMLKGMLFNMPRIIQAMIKKDYAYKDSGGHKNCIPADFLIAANGRLEIVYYGKDFTDHVPLKELDRVLNIK